MQDEPLVEMGGDDGDSDHYTTYGHGCGGMAQFINHSCDPNPEHMR